MKRLTAAQAAEWERIKQRISDAHCELNAALSEANAFRNDIVSEMDEYIAARSERWEASDAGASYQAWRDAWDDIDFSEPVEPDTDNATNEPEAQ